MTVGSLNTALRSGPAGRLALVLVVASGFAALGYQIVWTQQSTVWLGHESAAVLAVLAAFFGGLALGALLLGPKIDSSRTPARWYALCEAATGIWSLSLAALLGPGTAWLLSLLGAEPSPLRQWSIAFFGTFLLLLPATAAMGATLPAIERAVARLEQGGARVSVLYAANTFGAVLGVLVVAFWCVPALGMLRTAGLCALLNFACAGIALKLFAAPTAQPIVPPSLDARGLLPVLAITGLLGIGYEVLVVRALSQVSENTVYTFAILLAVYLVGTTLGATAYGIASGKGGDSRALRDKLLQALAVACVLGGLALGFAGDLRNVLLGWLGVGMPAALATEAVLATAALLPASFAMGALFSHLATGAVATGLGFGRALGINTLGAAAAPIAFGVLLLPALGLRSSIVIAAAGYLAITSQRAWRSARQWTAAGVVAAAWIFLPTMVFVDLPSGGRIVSIAEGVAATVTIVEDADGVARLQINNRQQEGSSATRLADARQALLPVLLHPDPRRALFLGVGTGITATAAAEDLGLAVDAVELVPEVIDASAYFTARLFAAEIRERPRLIAADARRYLRTSATLYDVIVSDNFHPARTGSGALYTVEHFEAVRGRLAADGLFCQWLPLHQLDLETLAIIVRSFLEIFPEGHALLATNSLETPVVGLVGRADGGRFDADAIAARLANADLATSAAEFGIHDSLALLGSFVAGPAALERLAAGAPLNTDDRPIVAYRAPRMTYSPESLPRDRLIEFLEAVDIDAADLLDDSRSAAFGSRLAGYWAARDRFIAAGRAVSLSQDVHAMLVQVQGPLLSVLAISPDFRPAYDPLLSMAIALGRSDPASARDLLQELQRLQPERPEAASALRDLGPRPLLLPGVDELE